LTDDTIDRRHNNGPPLDDDPSPRPWGEGGIGTWFEWTAAHDRVWKNVPYDIAVMRARRAEALGLTYREYTLEILERGRYLSPADADRILEIKLKRPVRY
jgi:hypothetical protein